MQQYQKKNPRLYYVDSMSSLEEHFRGLEEAFVDGEPGGEVFLGVAGEEEHQPLNGGRGVYCDRRIGLGEAQTTETLANHCPCRLRRLGSLLLQAEILSLALKFLCLAQDAERRLEARQELAVGRHHEPSGSTREAPLIE